MRWLLYHRSHEGHWIAPYGGMGLWLGMYAVLGLGSLALLSVSIWRIRRGRAESWLVIWWTLAMWVSLTLNRAAGAFPRHSLGWYLVFGASILLGAPWVVYGIWRVVPFLGREAAREAAERRVAKAGELPKGGPLP